MATLEDLAEPAVRKLLRADEEQLYEQLGLRVRGLTLDPGQSGSFEPDVVYDRAEMGAKEDLLDLGQRIFRRWNAEAQRLVCGGAPEEQEDRAKVLEAFGIGETAVAAMLAAVLVAHLGVAPAIAAVLAALVCKRFFRPAYEEFCSTWARSIQAHSETP